MPFTVRDVRDLTRVLTLHPEWRAEVRRLVLTDELLALPALVRELAAAQARAEERMSRLEAAMEQLAAAQARTEERMSRLEAAMEQLAAAQARTEEKVGRLATAVGQLQTAFGATMEEEAESVIRQQTAE